MAPGNDPVFVENEERPFGETFFFAVGAIGPGDGTLRFEVGCQRKMEMVILGVGSMAPRAVDRDAYQLGAEAFEVRQYLIVESHLIAANRAPVRRIEGQNHGFSSQLTERE